MTLNLLLKHFRNVSYDDDVCSLLKGISEFELCNTHLYLLKMTQWSYYYWFKLLDHF